MKLISTKNNEKAEIADSSAVFYVRASVTVEASWIVGICILIIGSLILTGYDVFADSWAFVKDVQVTKYDGIDLFRKGEAVKGLIDALKGGQ